MNKTNYGFEPIYNKNSTILILGSFPSVKSREVNFYYGNKQNRFWKMLENIYNQTILPDIDSKKEFLLINKIALWDIVKKSKITSSSDNQLTHITLKDINNIAQILPPNSSITKILCNGTKSFQLAKKFIKTSIPIILMPSTSPANFKFDIEKWKKELIIKS